MRMIVTIDGPAGSGKSTIARKLAARLNVAYLDTGAMYRAVAHTALQRGVDLANEEALVELAGSLHLELDCGPTRSRIRVDGCDVSEEIRTIKVSAATSQVARCQAVRDLLVRQQRDLGASLGSFVSEGRDQGSVVFPDADARFLLEASLEERTRRRRRELVTEGEDVDEASVIADLRARDSVDAKQWAALLAPGRAVVVDTTSLTIADVIDRMLAYLR